MVGKRSGATEPFTRDKIVRGVRRACQGRPVSEDQLAILAQQVGDAIRARGCAEVPSHDVGLAILGTVAWSAVASSLHSAGSAAAGHAAQTAAYNHALAYGFGRGYLVAAGIALLAVVISIIFIRIKRSDLAGVNPMAAP